MTDSWPTAERPEFTATMDYFHARDGWVTYYDRASLMWYRLRLTDDGFVWEKSGPVKLERNLPLTSLLTEATVAESGLSAIHRVT